MNPTKYVVEIYSPGSIETVLRSFESSSPFMAVGVGDIIDPRWWNLIEVKGVLKITSLVHGFWETGKNNTHKIMIYTQEIKGPGLF